MLEQQSRESKQQTRTAASGFEVDQESEAET